MTNILVVDDDPLILRSLARVLGLAGHTVATTSEPSETVPLALETSADVILLDVRMAVSGFELLKKLKQHEALTAEVIMMTGTATIADAIEAVKQGAFDFLEKPFVNTETLLLRIQKAYEHSQLVRKTRELPSACKAVWGSSPAMNRVVSVLNRAGPSHASVLITGETGTGKEVAARALYELSSRNNKPFVAVNCSALTEQLIESELFGHEKGSFTGAQQRRDGLFIEAAGGTLFLDEIGEMPHALQAKLLRVLQNGEVRRVGSNQTVKTDVRVIAATNRDLAAEVKAGTFRQDLYYRLNVVHLHIPPLRERRQDVLMYANYFLRRKQAETAPAERKSFAPITLEFLDRYRWPGNIRELENAVERAIVLSPDRLIFPHALPEEVLDNVEVNQLPAGVRVDFAYHEAKQRALERFEQLYVASVLACSDSNLSRAASLAGMDRSNFRKIVLRTGVHVKQDAREPIDSDGVDERPGF